MAKVAITGMGLVTAQGVGVEGSWAGVVAGDGQRISPWKGEHGLPGGHPLLSLKVAQCPALPRPADMPARLWNRLSRTQQLACVATDEALAIAGLPRKLAEMRVGLFLATTVCGMDQNERYYAQYRLDKDAADIDLMRRLQPYEVGALLSRRHGIDHQQITPQICLTTCVGSAMAIAAAADAIELGDCDLAVAGGSESLCRIVLSGFHALKVVSAEGCRPFDQNRPGITVGEGAGILILENAAHAEKRGARPLAYLRGAGITCDAYHLTAPDPAAAQPARAIHIALHRAGLLPTAIDYINAHGTGTRDNDSMETAALRAQFGQGTMPPVSSTKRCTGHTFGAAAAIEAIFCIQAIRTGIAPMNTGSITPDPTLDLPVIRGRSLNKKIRAALSTNFAFGGNNSALIFADSPDHPGATT